MKTPITIPVVVPLLALLLLGVIPPKAQGAQDSIPQGSQPPAASPASPCQQGKGHDKKWLSVLNDQERAQIKAAMKQVKNNPRLVAARQAIKDAQTKEVKTAAHETLRQTRRDLMLKADPSLGPVLDKIKASKSAKPSVS